jgi:hypothetical protein
MVQPHNFVAVLQRILAAVPNDYPQKDDLRQSFKDTIGKDSVRGSSLEKRSEMFNHRIVGALSRYLPDPNTDTSPDWSREALRIFQEPEYAKTPGLPEEPFIFI